MNQLFERIIKALSSWKFWIVVPPWDVGVRIRLGRTAMQLSPGPHWRVPMVDEIVFINTRLRIITTPPVTLQGREGRSRTRSVVLGYYVRDPLLAMMAFNKPSTAVQGYAQAQAAEPGMEEAACREALVGIFAEKGIEIDFVRYTENVEAQTIRLLQNSWSLDTDAPNYGPVGAQERY